MIDHDRERFERGLPAASLPPVQSLRRIDEVLRDAHVAGAGVAVIRAGELSWSAGYGRTWSDGSDAVTSDTIFQACSISKAVASLAALRLVEDGSLDLDEDVNRRLVSWRVPANGGWQPVVTVRQLLSHSAALTPGWYPGYLRGTSLPSTPQILRGEPPVNTPPVRVTGVPGLRFRYAGSHFTLVQQLLEDVTGSRFAELIQALVFEPLGMRRSSYDQQFPERHPSLSAHGHNVAGDPIEGGWRELPEQAAAGLWTSPADLAQVAVELHRAWTGQATRILNQATVREMLSPQCEEWGLGWKVWEHQGRRFAEHGGDNIGYKCRLLLDVERGEGIAVMTNGDDGASVVRDVIAAASRTYGWEHSAGSEEILREPASSWPDYPESSAVDAMRAGTYITSVGSSFTLVANDGLSLIAPGQPPLRLRRVAERVYASPLANVAIIFHDDQGDGEGRCTAHLDGVDVEAWLEISRPV